MWLRNGEESTVDPVPNKMNADPHITCRSGSAAIRLGVASELGIGLIRYEVLVG